MADVVASCNETWLLALTLTLAIALLHACTNQESKKEQEATRHKEVTAWAAGLELEVGLLGVGLLGVGLPGWQGRGADADGCVICVYMLACLLACTYGHATAHMWTMSSSAPVNPDHRRWKRSCAVPSQ